jgi:hypothetical protein
MRQPRLLWLVLVMCGLAILRVLAPSSSRDAMPTTAEAFVRKAPVAKRQAAATLPASTAYARSASPINDFDDPGNAFAVRPPPPPPYVPPVVFAKTRPAPLAPAPMVAAAPTEPPPPPMPYQVIGTWDDGKEPGVFLSSANGTLLARPGTTLQAEYRVTAITPQQIVLLHLATQREVRLAVSRPPNTPRPYP